MNIAVTGASGLVGSALVSFLTSEGHRVVRLVRSLPRAQAEEVQWDPERGLREPALLEGLDAVVHLAGANIAEGRWTPERKRLIRKSRVAGTRNLTENLLRLSAPPQVLLCASAIGYYGDREDEVLGEESAAGTGFLAEVCKEWEKATHLAEERGVRVIHARLGIVLAAHGGALAKMLPPFRFGLGGVLGDGSQYMSWIALDDVVGALYQVLLSEQISGAVNIVAPNAVTNREFTKTLGRVLRRPTWLPFPAFAARLMFGEMADALLLASTRVEPRQLLATGYTFRYGFLDAALRHVLA
ncbi:MAG: TIGR01777 family protein [Deltaproteobacteria bacterium]|nr:TIGR01777 family protein [Deltaproteobacteria bacterium]